VDGAVGVSSTALVTGAAGFIGTNLCRKLLDLGVTVHGVSRSAQPASEVVWHRADASDPAAVEALVSEARPDVVYHLASRVTGSIELAEVRATFDANLGASVAVFEAAAECGCRRVVTAGSGHELGLEGGAPGSPYAAAKVATTAYARMFHRAFDLSIVNLRLFMVYGPGQRDSTKLVPYTITSLLSGVPPELTSGDRRFDWVYVDDVIDALVVAGNTELGDDGAPIDIGTGRLASIREVVGRITLACATDLSPRFGVRPDRKPEPSHSADLEPARRLLEWSPQTSLADGIDATVAWYRAAR
jgi:nucleoside-diphosphate-sugar epimerase